MKKNEKFKLLTERFFNLAQDILCNAEAAKEVAHNAICHVKEKYPTNFQVSDAPKIVNQEIENFFQRLLIEIRKNSKVSEEKLMSILENKFTLTVRYKISNDPLKLSNDDAEDIVVNALKTVNEKYRAAHPKGTFFLWAMKILSNKYLEYRRKIKRIRQREIRLTDEFRKITHTTKISDFISRAKKEKEISPDEEKGLILEKGDLDPFQADPYDWSPTVLLENEDLKKHLLKISREMSERCKKVFEILFSRGDVRSVHQELPGMSRQQIDVIISRCRKKLKNEAIARGILG